MAADPKVRTCLWFHSGGSQAAEFYVSLLENSRIESEMSFAGDDEPILVNFTLAGTPYQILSGGPHQTLSPAASISVTTGDQDETDRLWSALLDGGGSEIACGWLTDRFGVSWQIVPRRLIDLMTHDDPGIAARTRRAMERMVKIDIAALDRAAAHTENA